MLYTTRGIVLKTVKYSENSIIAKVYTEHFGLRSYIFKGVSSKQGHSKKALLQGLSLLNMVVYEKQSASLQNIKEIDSAYAYKSIPFDIRKSTIVLFLNEVIYKSIGEEVPNKPLFAFIFAQMVNLDNAEENFADFHTYFLINFCAYLGILPQNSFSESNRYFDIQEGVFVGERPFHSNFLEPDLSKKLSLTLEDSESKIFVNAAGRNVLLEKIIQYYILHVPGFGEIKSFPILKQVLS